MSRVGHHDALRHELERLGFELVPVGRPGWHLRRRRARVDDHVALIVRGSWLQRVRGRARGQVRAGVVVPQVEQTFIRPVPQAPAIPGEVHATMSLDQPGTPDAGIICGWFDQWHHALDLLDAGVLADAVLAVEFAVTARSRDLAARAAAVARAQLAADDSAPGRLRSRRLETAASQLGI